MKKETCVCEPKSYKRIQLKPQINENNPKYRNMKVKTKFTMKKDSPLRIRLLYQPT
jgi:hypothetical protein